MAHLKKLLPHKLTFLLLTSLFLTVSSSCRNNINNVKEIFRDLPIETIDVDFSIKKPIALSTVFDTVEFIPLETTKNSFFAEITSMETTKDYFIIYDQSSNSILFFFKNGKFSSKISNYGLTTTKSYKKIKSFTIDRTSSQIIINDSNQNKMIFYDFKGNKIKEIMNPFYYRTFYSSGNSNIIYYRSNYYTDNEALTDPKSKFSNLFFTKNLTDIKKALFPYDPKKINDLDLYSVRKNFYTSDYQNCILAFPYTYDAYNLDSGNVKSIYRFMLPEENKLPEDFMTNDEYMNKRISYVSNKANDKKIYSLTNLFTVNDKCVTFCTYSFGMTPRSFFYNKRTKEVVNFENIFMDKTAYFLPVTSNEILGSDNSCLYTDISAESLFTHALQDDVNSAIKHNKTLNNFITSSTNQSNPIIIKLHVK
ncbi:6-bladed beta-propeller [Pedobacter frigiditerrae]|uniref:6-bladed beta-propeller n=1 Tax=Pedobacter frigiditerrae TaxID=2530452 RepID=A0A4R0MWI4_9SPHI|nr:6-bladed beta-propeller [Pedobacter frigiditerrae]TCC90592.1 6-bladed beta-propeller [Pedobacter frigiditerrae]